MKPEDKWHEIPRGYIEDFRRSEMKSFMKHLKK